MARRASVLGVHVLDKDDSEIAKVFGGETGDEVDKFAQVAWHSGPRGVGVPATEVFERQAAAAR